MNSKERYEKCKKNSICVRCHKRPATHGVKCDVCYEKAKDYNTNYDKEVYEWRKTKGICVACGNEKSEQGHVLCLTCRMDRREKKCPTAENKSEKNMKKYYELKSKGICVACAKREVSKNHVFCELCLAQRRYKASKIRIKQGVLPRCLMGNGEYCSTCGKPVENKGKKLCNRCYQNSLESIKKALENPPKENYFRMLNNAFWNTRGGSKT